MGAHKEFIVTTGTNPYPWGGAGKITETRNNAMNRLEKERFFMITLHYPDDYAVFSAIQKVLH